MKNSIPLTVLALVSLAGMTDAHTFDVGPIPVKDGKAIEAALKKAKEGMLPSVTHKEQIVELYQKQGPKQDTFSISVPWSVSPQLRVIFVDEKNKPIGKPEYFRWNAPEPEKLEGLPGPLWKVFPTGTKCLVCTYLVQGIKKTYKLDSAKFSN